MPRPPNYILQSYFTRTRQNKIVCVHGYCDGKVLHPHSPNLERHLKKYHTEMYAQYMKQRHCAFLAKQKSCDRNEGNSESSAAQLNRHNVELAIVKLFSVCGQSLSLLEQRPFQLLVQPTFDLLGVAVNKRCVSELIAAHAQQLKVKLTQELKAKLLSLSLSVVTKRGLSVLGLHAQYIADGKLRLKTLKVKDLITACNSEYLKTFIEAILQEYAIDVQQIISLTMNYESNMNATNVECTSADLDLVAEAAAHFAAQHSIEVVYSGVHALQVCAAAVLHSGDNAIKLEQCRAMAREFIIVSDYEDQSDQPLAALDWHTDFKLCSSLLQIRHIISSGNASDASMQFTDVLWGFLDDFVSTFKPFENARTKLTAPTLCYSELYIIMMDLIFEIENLPASSLRNLLRDVVLARKTLLFQNPLLNAAIFLDPRINICLNAQQIVEAKQYIKKLQQRLNALLEHPNDPASQSPFIMDIKTEEPMPSISSVPQAPKSLSEFLQKLDPATATNDAAPLSWHIEADFHKYQRQPRQPLASNVLDFWAASKSCLASLANVLLAIPFTAGDQQRTQTALKYLLTDDAHRFADDVEHMLLLKVNGDFNYEEPLTSLAYSVSN